MKGKYVIDESPGIDTGTESKVVPNEALTVREMLIKNANGTLYDNFKTPYYEEQAVFSTKPLNVIQSMTEIEKIDYLNEVTKQANELRKSIQSHVNEKLKEAQERALEAEQRKGVQKASEE